MSGLAGPDLEGADGAEQSQAAPDGSGERDDRRIAAAAAVHKRLAAATGEALGLDADAEASGRAAQAEGVDDVGILLVALQVEDNLDPLTDVDAILRAGVGVGGEISRRHEGWRELV